MSRATPSLPADPRGRTRRWRAARAFLRDGRGGAAVEFAIVGVPLLALIVGGLQVCVLFFAGQALETFTETTGRAILVGTTQASGYTQAQFKASLCAKLPSLFQCSNLFVDVTTVSSFASANLAAPTLTYDSTGNVTNTWNYAPGTAGDIVVLRLMYLWPVVGLPNGVSFANQTAGGRLLLTTAVFQNEASS